MFDENTIHTSTILFVAERFRSLRLHYQSSFVLPWVIITEFIELYNMNDPKEILKG